MKFLADGMLGKLTRWLRMLGYDVKYSSRLRDNQLVQKAEEERRVLLTKDLKLYQQAAAKGVDAFYIEGEREGKKLARLARKLGIRLSIEMTKSRCPKCNTRVNPISKEEVVDRIKQGTFKYYSNFWECPKCKQVYWQGSHWKGIRKTLKRAREKTGRL